MTSATVVHDEVVPARSPWTRRRATPATTCASSTSRATRPSTSSLYDADDPVERYSAPDTIAAQGNIFLTTGTVLLSNEGRPMMTIVDDTCGRHDTIGGACSCESNTLRYGHHTKHQHACVENFLAGRRRATGWASAT